MKGKISMMCVLKFFLQCNVIIDERNWKPVYTCKRIVRTDLCTPFSTVDAPPPFYVVRWTFLSRNNEIEKKKRSNLNLSSERIARFTSRNYDLAVVIN